MFWRGLVKKQYCRLHFVNYEFFTIGDNIISLIYTFNKIIISQKYFRPTFYYYSDTVSIVPYYLCELLCSFVGINYLMFPICYFKSS